MSGADGDVSAEELAGRRLMTQRRAEAAIATWATGQGAEPRATSYDYDDNGLGVKVHITCRGTSYVATYRDGALDVV